ncbi:MAG: ABC transporter ATP-binding protein [Anaerolineales bacterium]|jgi:multiple sugar transport system ATP-binding protein
MAFLQLEGITKKFGDTLAVDRLDLQVEKGEFLVLLGPSGCGKTTTLRIVAGLQVQTEGRLILDGSDISDIPPENRNMAMVFQNLALYPHMSVFDNIAFYLRNIRTPKDEIENRVQRAADRVQIGELLDRWPNQLSGGQKQRVALARALVRSPKVFLLDEPLASLDAKLRASMRSEFKLIHKSLVEETGGDHGTFIYVTHDQVEALTLGTRVAVMNEGRIVQVALPKDLYHKPNDLFTATFVGSPEMNLMRGFVQRVNGAFHFEFSEQPVSMKFQAANESAAIGSEKHDTFLGIRPESVAITNPNDPDAIKAEILTIELLGQSNLVRLKVGEGLHLICLAPLEQEWREEEIVGVRFQPKAVHFFDAQSGKRI